jgi:predicted molibdopterin-dependent oxidoreductase YjgC
MPSSGRFRRLKPGVGAEIEIEVDGRKLTAREGDTVLVAVLSGGGETLRQSEFGDGPRAGFCLMGACQDCWMWTADGARLRACTTRVQAGMRLSSGIPSEALWPNRA